MNHDHSLMADEGALDKHEGHSPEMFRDRLWVSLALSVPILYFSTQIQEWFGYEAVSFAGDNWVVPVLATVLFFYAGSVFLRGGAAELRHRVPGMMTLISMAIAVAYGYSLAVSLGLDGDPFYWELATLLDVMLLGHWMEMRSVQAAGSALQDLAAMVPSTAHLLAADGSIGDTSVDRLTLGDRIIVRPGEQVPIDGDIVDGASSYGQRPRGGALRRGDDPGKDVRLPTRPCQVRGEVLRTRGGVADARSTFSRNSTYRDTRRQELGVSPFPEKTRDPVVGFPSVGGGRPQDAALRVEYNDESLVMDRVGGGLGQGDAGGGDGVVDTVELKVGGGCAGRHFAQPVATRRQRCRVVQEIVPCLGVDFLCFNVTRRPS